MNPNTRTRWSWAAAGMLVPSAWLMSQAVGAEPSDIVYTAREPLKVRLAESAPTAKTSTAKKSSPMSGAGKIGNSTGPVSRKSTAKKAPAKQPAAKSPAVVPAAEVQPVELLPQVESPGAIQQVQGEELTPVQRALIEEYRKAGRPIPEGAIPTVQPANRLVQQGAGGNQGGYVQTAGSPAQGGYPTTGPAPQKKPSFWSRMVPGFMKRKQTAQTEPRQSPPPYTPPAGQNGARSAQQRSQQPDPQYAQPRHFPPEQTTSQVDDEPEPQAQQPAYQAPNRLRQAQVQPPAQPQSQPNHLPDLTASARRPVITPQPQDELLIDEPAANDADSLTVLDEKPTPKGQPTVSPLSEPNESAPQTASSNGSEESPFSGRKVDLTRETEIAESTQPAAPPTRRQPETPLEPATPKAPEAPALTEGEMPKLMSPAEELEGLKGYCLVTLKSDRKLVEGQKEFMVTYRNHIYRFASAEAKAEFERTPEVYAPAHNGRDVVRMADGRQDVDGSIDHAVWYRGRLFMFANAASQTAFVTAPGKFAASVTPVKEDE